MLARLAPGAPIGWASEARGSADAGGPDTEHLLRQIPPNARRGALSDPHTPLLRGQPPLTYECGVMFVEFEANRPFHPERLNKAIDVLLDGVVTARGRAWAGTQPDEALWLESAGGGLRVAPRWDEPFGDRHTSLVVLVHAADPTEINRALQWALVDDDELAHPEQWATWPDPFGDFPEDPCADSESRYAETEPNRKELN